METITAFDPDIMSKETGISAYEIKEALGLPIDPKCYATTVDEAKRAYEDAPEYSEAREWARKKWIELAATPEEAKRAYDECLRDSLAHEFAEEKWRQLSLKEIKSANTAEEIEKAYKETRIYSEERKLAFKKWIELVKTPQEAKKAWGNSVPGKSAEKDLLIKKWDELSKMEIENADTLEKATEAYAATPAGLESAKLALKNLATFYGWEG